jgi:hypothetical protein
MRLGAVIPDVLPDLHFPQFADHPGSQQKADKKGRQAGVNGPERNVTEYVKYRKRRMQRV